MASLAFVNRFRGELLSRDRLETPAEGRLRSTMVSDLFRLVAGAALPFWLCRPTGDSREFCFRNGLLLMMKWLRFSKL